MPEAISYSRVSTLNQKISGFSLSEQKKIIQEYAYSKGYQIYLTISKTKSVKNNCDLDIKLKKNTHIIFADVSRFSRNIDSGLSTIKKIVNKNVTVHFVRENFCIDKSSFGNKNSQEYKKLLMGLTAANQESEILGKRIRDIKSYKKENGEYIGGKLSFGLDLYEKIIIDSEGQRRKVKKYKWNENEKKIIEFIELCRSPPFTSFDLNKSMGEISVYDDPIELVHENDEHGDTPLYNTEAMTNNDIASLLNEYEVKYRGGKTFTASIVKNIKSLYILEKYIKVGGDYYMNEAQFDMIDIDDNSEYDDLENIVNRVKCININKRRKVCNLL